MSKRILVVEDQPDNRQIIRDMLAGTGYEITEAEDGEQALAAVAKERPDLILMGIQPPHENCPPARAHSSLMSAFDPERTSSFWPSREFKHDHVCAISGGEDSKRDDRHGEPFAGSGKQCVEKREPEHGLIFREMAMIKKAAGKNDMSKCILVVDDQPDNRQIIRDMLALTDYEITEAENGELALAAIAKQRPDLILMDIQLPIMDGYTATSRIKSDPKLQSIPIIAVTSYALSGEDSKARAAGCDECVAKPFSPRRLLPKIRHYLQ